MSSTTFSYNSSCSDYVRQRHEDVDAEQRRRRSAFREVSRVKVEGDGINDTVTGALNEFLVKVDMGLRARSRVEMRLVDENNMNHPIYQEEVYGVGYRGRYVVAVPGTYKLTVDIDIDDGDFYDTVGSTEIHVVENPDLLSSLLETCDLLLKQVQEKSRKMHENKKNLRAEQAKTAKMLEKLKECQAHFDIQYRSAMLSSIEIGKFRREYVAESETLSPRASREKSPTPPVNQNPPPPPSSTNFLRDRASDISVHTGDSQSPVGSLQDNFPIDDVVNSSSPVNRTSKKRKSSDDPAVLNLKKRCVPSTLLPPVRQVNLSRSRRASPPVGQANLSRSTRASPPVGQANLSRSRRASPPVGQANRSRSRRASPPVGQANHSRSRRASPPVALPWSDSAPVPSDRSNSPPGSRVSSPGSYSEFLPRHASSPRRSRTRVQSAERDSPTLHQQTIRTQVGGLLPVVRLRRLEERPTTRYNLRWLYKKKYNDNEKDCEEKVHKVNTKRYALRKTKRPDYREKEENDV